MFSRYSFGFLIIFLIAAVALAAPVPKYKPPKETEAAQLLKTLQGTWDMQTMSASLLNNLKLQQLQGRAVILANSTQRIRIDGDQWSYVRNVNGTEQVATTYKMKLDTSKKPVWLDLVRENSDTPYLQGIITIEGDTVKFCYITTASVRQGATRPDSFEITDPNSRHVLMTLTRSNP